MTRFRALGSFSERARGKRPFENVTSRRIDSAALSVEIFELRKGSLCDGLKKRYGLVHVSPGQLLREEVERETELGLKAGAW